MFFLEAPEPEPVPIFSIIAACTNFVCCFQAVVYMRHIDAIRQAFNRRRIKERGKLGRLPKTTDELVETGVPLAFHRTQGGEPFLRYVKVCYSFGLIFS